MNILMFTWKYPPMSHGGLARHVQDLSHALKDRGHSIYIITQGQTDIPGDSSQQGLRVIRTDPLKISPDNFIDSILHLNYQLLEKAFKLRLSGVDIDLIHGHDWLVFWASKVMKHALQKPLIYTIHATESGRNQGIYNQMQRYINDIEWYATFEAWRVIICSQYMKNEVRGLFQVPEDKLELIKNGVDPRNYTADYSRAFRDRYADPSEELVFYVGRIVREKGIQVLIQAIPEVLRENPSTKFVIAGKGPFLDNLKQQADFLGVADRIYFAGFISDEDRNRLYRVADLAVFPSLYEPFGIVALEAMASRTPVIASGVGGMDEYITDGENGLKVEPNNPYQLANSIKYVLNNKQQASRMASAAYDMIVRDFDWGQIADKTARVYRKVLKEYGESDWSDQQQELPVYGQQEAEPVYNEYKYR